MDVHSVVLVNILPMDEVSVSLVPPVPSRKRDRALVLSVLLVPHRTPLVMRAKNVVWAPIPQATESANPALVVPLLPTLVLRSAQPVRVAPSLREILVSAVQRVNLLLKEVVPV